MAGFALDVGAFVMISHEIRTQLVARDRRSVIRSLDPKFRTHGGPALQKTHVFGRPLPSAAPAR